MPRSKRPHPHEYPALPEGHGLKWLTADRITMDEADEMLHLWNHYRQRTAPGSAPPRHPRQRDGPAKG